MSTFDFAAYLGQQGAIIFFLGLVLVMFPSIFLLENRNRKAVRILIGVVSLGVLMVLAAAVLWSLSIWNYANA